MKKIILFAICLIPVFAYAQEGTYTIQGKIGKLNDPAKVFLMYSAGDEAKTDTAAITNGAFTFSGKINDPKIVRLIVSHDGSPAKGPNSDNLVIYLEKGTINVQTPDSIKNAVISGSVTNAENLQLKKALEPVNKKLEGYMGEYDAASDEDKKNEESPFMVAFMKKYEDAQKEKEEARKAFIKANPGSIVSLDLLNNISSSMKVEQIEPIYNGFSEKVRNSESGKLFAKRIQKLKATAIGAIAPDFTQNDPNGNPIKLSDFRGKYLLIDFWASWCGPCRKENPNVVKAYNTFKDKNFEILGVSLDDENRNGKAMWLKAIEKDGLTWPQVSDLKFWKNDVAQLYVIQSIPQNLLLDPTGKIIAKNLRGEELQSKLAELLK